MFKRLQQHKGEEHDSDYYYHLYGSMGEEHMKKLISTLQLSREEWLRYRKQGIGGSDAGAVCGLNPYRTAAHVYLDKITEDVEEIDNESMRQGRDLEEYVARRFMEETGLKVRRSNYMYQHEEYPFMVADVDRMIVGERAGLECKTASAYSAGKWKDGQIPPHYLIQCVHYMAVTNADCWYLAVVILGQGFQWTKIERDEELIQNLIQIEQNFWENYVQAGVLPEADGSDAYTELLNQHFHTARKGMKIQLSGFQTDLKRRQEIVEQIKALEQEKNQIEQTIKKEMGESEWAIGEDYRIHWSNVESTKIDTRRLKAERPDIYTEFSKEVKSRRFQILAA